MLGNKLSKIAKLLSIQCLSASSSPQLQSKSVTPQTYSQTITADSRYDGLSNVIVNASKTNKLLWKTVSHSSQTTSIIISTTDWGVFGNNSIVVNDWSMADNVLYIQGDDTTNRITGAIKRVVIIANQQNSFSQLTCMYDGNLQYPNLYWKQGDSSTILPRLQTNGSILLTAQGDFFIGPYMCFSVGLSY